LREAGLGPTGICGVSVADAGEYQRRVHAAMERSFAWVSMAVPPWIRLEGSEYTPESASASDAARGAATLCKEARDS
jgi:hypothetical protein